MVAARRWLPQASQGRAPHPDARDPLGRARGGCAGRGARALMTGPARITTGAFTDPSHLIRFRFDGKELTGLAGDTLASALLANGMRQVGRSFKYHRPRGIVTAGPDEPCALVDVIGKSGREPNQLATTLPLYEGLVAESQNRWPSLRFDARAINGLL